MRIRIRDPRSCQPWIRDGRNGQSEVTCLSPSRSGRRTGKGWAGLPHPLFTKGCRTQDHWLLGYSWLQLLPPGVATRLPPLIMDIQYSYHPILQQIHKSASKNWRNLGLRLMNSTFIIKDYTCAVEQFGRSWTKVCTFSAEPVFVNV